MFHCKFMQIHANSMNSYKLNGYLDSTDLRTFLASTMNKMGNQFQIYINVDVKFD